MRSFAFALLLSLGLLAQAAVYEVSPDDDLRTAIAALKLGDELWLAGRVYLLNTRFNIIRIGGLRTRAGQGPFIPEESIDSHVVWDMVAAWQFTPQLSTYVKVDNLFDETYIAARRPAGVRPGLPRTAYLGLTYRL